MRLRMRGNLLNTFPVVKIWDFLVRMLFIIVACLSLIIFSDEDNCAQKVGSFNYSTLSSNLFLVLVTWCKSRL